MFETCLTIMQEVAVVLQSLYSFTRLPVYLFYKSNVLWHFFFDATEWNNYIFGNHLHTKIYNVYPLFGTVRQMCLLTDTLKILLCWINCMFSVTPVLLNTHDDFIFDLSLNNDQFHVFSILEMIKYVEWIWYFVTNFFSTTEQNAETEWLQNGIAPLGADL